MDVAKARSHFPALKDGFIFADNAGGSQALQEVVDRISDYLLNTNVQLGPSISRWDRWRCWTDLRAFTGADYSVSAKATQRVEDGARQTAVLINASLDEVAFGPSSTMLTENLARALEKDVLDGEEFIVTGEHECSRLHLRAHKILLTTAQRTAGPGKSSPRAAALPSRHGRTPSPQTRRTTRTPSNSPSLRSRRSSPRRHASSRSRRAPISSARLSMCRRL